MKKNLKKKALIPAIAMVLASVIALSGVTYAWFTTGNTATVETLNVNVQTANGIQVSVDATNWKSVIGEKDIVDAINNGITYTSKAVQWPEKEVAPVSSNGVVSGGRLQMFEGGYADDGTLSSTLTSDVNGSKKDGLDVNYVAFDLFFKTSSETVQPLYFKIGQDQSFVNTVFKGTDPKTCSAVRVAFIDLGRTDSTDPADAHKLVGDASTTAVIWEPNAKLAAQGDNRQDKAAYKGFNTSFTGVKEEALESTKIEGVDAVASVSTFTDSITLTNLQKGVTKVRVYIWLEGQDVDCINSISFGDFVTNLYFEVDKPST